jgi:hypothetical protein
MLGLAACRITRCVRFAHCAQTDAASQLLMRAARAAASPALLGAAKSLRLLPDPDFAEPFPRAPPSRAVVLLAKPRAGGRWCDFAAPRSAGFRASARSAPPLLTCGICPSAVNAVNVASYAAGPGAEHRRAVDAQRRPPQPERHRPPARGFAPVRPNPALPRATKRPLDYNCASRRDRFQSASTQSLPTPPSRLPSTGARKTRAAGR